MNRRHDDDTRALPYLLAALLAMWPTAAAAQANQVDEELMDGDDENDLPSETARPPILGLGVSFGTMRLGDATWLAAHGERSGLGPLSRFQSLAEPSLSISLARLVLEARSRVAWTASDGGLGVSTLGGAFGVGYLMLTRPDVLLYPSLGLGVTQTQVTFGSSREVEGGTTFDTLTRASGPATLSNRALTAEVALDAHYRVVGHDGERRGVYLGGRAGITAALARSTWTLDDHALPPREAPGPAAPVSGPFLAVALGVRY